MNIHIHDKVLEFKNDPDLTEEVFDIINEHLMGNGLNFSHLVIDGEEIYNDFEKYIIENIKNIKKIEVVAAPVSEVVNDCLLSSEQYFKNAIPIINNISEEFYQKPKENTWSQLADLFEGIQWVIQLITQISLVKVSSEMMSEYEVWDEYVEEASKFNDIIPELENAILNNDNVLIADMLLYEVIPVFESLEEKLNLLIPEVVDIDADR